VIGKQSRFILEDLKWIKKNAELDNSNYSCCWIFNNQYCAWCTDLFLA